MYSKVNEYETMEKKNPPIINVIKCRVLPNKDVTAIEETRFSNENKDENADLTKLFIEKSKKH